MVPFKITKDDFNRNGITSSPFFLHLKAGGSWDVRLSIKTLVIKKYLSAHMVEL